MIEKPQPLFERATRIIRFPLLIATLVPVLYFTIYVLFVVPIAPFEYSWSPDNRMWIVAADSSMVAEQRVQRGDTILAVNGRLAYWFPGYSLFQFGEESHTYTIDRNGHTFTIELDADSFDTLAMSKRAIAPLVSLMSWVLGALALLFALPTNRDAWQLGGTTLFVAVVLAASEALEYGAAAATLLYTPLVPTMAVAWVQVAFLPRQTQPSKREKILFRSLYIIAAVFGFLALYEALFVFPTGTSWQAQYGISTLEVALTLLTISLVAHVVILGCRFFYVEAPYQRRQLGIILVFTFVACLPFILLTLMPRLTSGMPFLPWEFGFLLLALIPAGYAYVIFRRNFLALDLFVSRGLTGLIVSLVLLVAYGLVFYFLQRNEAEPALTNALVLPILLVFPFTNRQGRGIIESLLYGNVVQYQNSLGYLTETLSVQPQATTLQHALTSVGELLQIRQMALLVQDKHRFTVLAQLQADSLQAISAVSLQNELENIAPRSLLHKHELPSTLAWPWVCYLIPLFMKGELMGILVLGRPIPDGYLNRPQADFLFQTVSLMAIAVEAIHLFESSRAMSRQLLETREEERIQIVARIHDEPLQRLALMTGELGQLARHTNLDEVVATKLQNHSNTLNMVTTLLRDVCMDLYSPLFFQGPQWVVSEIVDTFNAQTELFIQLETQIDDTLIVSEQVNRTLSHVLTEAMNNIVKHANAQQVWIQLIHEEAQDVLILSVTDDGKAASPSFLSLPDLVRQRHFGLVGMHELVRSIGGELHISPRGADGTVLKIVAPLND